MLLRARENSLIRCIGFIISREVLSDVDNIRFVREVFLNDQTNGRPKNVEFENESAR